MRLVRALLGGTAGAVLVWIIVSVTGRASHNHADLCMLLGTSLTGNEDLWAWVAGAVAQLALGMVAAVVYAAIFEWVTRRAGGAAGFVVSLPHAVVAGIAVGFLPAQRLLDAGVGPPGAFLEYRGLAVMAAFVVAHLVFGTLVGALYRHPRHPAAEPGAVWLNVYNGS